jgi:hypothetical protein
MMLLLLSLEKYLFHFLNQRFFFPIVKINRIGRTYSYVSIICLLELFIRV